MIEIVSEKNLAQYEQFIASHPKGHFMQSIMWARQKPEWRWQAIMVRRDDGEIAGSCAVLIRKVPGMPFTLMYGCRGPVCDIRDKAVMAELTEGLRKLARENKSYTLKLDPDVEAEDVQFWQDMQSLGYRLPPAGKNFEGIQPRFVFRLYLEGRSKDELMASFESKWRYNIRLAGRKGVTVEIENEKGLDEFSDLMLQTGVRDGFVTRKKEYFENMLKNLGDHARLYMARYEGRAIAGTLAVAFGDKVWYLYGASSNEDRNLMPNNLLQWEMISWAQELGARVYDFRGVSGDLSEDNPLYGLYRFKKGFNGKFTEFGGELEMVLRPGAAVLVKYAQKAFMSVRRLAYLAKNRK